MSIDNATPEEWDIANDALRWTTSVGLDALDIEELNHALDRPFGEVPLLLRAYVFLLHQMDKVKIEYIDRNDKTWHQTDRPGFGHDAIYRIVVFETPKTKPSIDWSHFAPQCKWLARDANYDAWVYADRPKRLAAAWFSHDATRVNSLISYAAGDCDWEDSLVERPAGV